MSFEAYGQSFAELYDVFYGSKPYAAEAAFLDRIFRRNMGLGALQMLECACGTGNHSIEFERLGYNVEATDLSESMVAIATGKSARHGNNASFAAADMRKAGKGDGSKDVVICLFDSIGYLLENEAIVAALTNVRKNLRKGGLCAIEYWYAGAMLSNGSPLRIRSFETNLGRVVRTSATTCVHANQWCSVKFEVFVLEKDGKHRTFMEEHLNRYFLPKEMDLLFEAAGLRTEGRYSGYADDTAINDQSWHIVQIGKAL